MFGFLSQPFDYMFYDWGLSLCGAVVMAVVAGHAVARNKKGLLAVMAIGVGLSLCVTGDLLSEYMQMAGQTKPLDNLVPQDLLYLEPVTIIAAMMFLALAVRAFKRSLAMMLWLMAALLMAAYTANLQLDRGDSNIQYWVTMQELAYSGLWVSCWAAAALATIGWLNKDKSAGKPENANLDTEPIDLDAIAKANTTAQADTKVYSVRPLTAPGMEQF